MECNLNHQNMFYVVHFTRNESLKTKASSTVNGIKIESSSEVKYLDVIFYQEFAFTLIFNMSSKRAPVQ